MIAKNVKISPRKIRLVSDAVRDLSLVDMLSELAVLEKRAATPLRKALESAVSNANHVSKLKKEDLEVTLINITEGIKYKRFRYAGRGRTRPYVKRTSHINIILEDKKDKNAQVSLSDPKKEKEKEGEAK